MKFLNAFFLSASILLAGCESETPPDPADPEGYLRVTTVATGDSVPQTFAVVVDLQLMDEVVDANGTMLYGPLRTGTLTVTLAAPANCEVFGPRSAGILEGDTAFITYQVPCQAQAGVIRVLVTTTGTNVPATFNALIGQVASGPVPSNGSADFTVSHGTYSVLLQVPGNCTVQSLNPAPGTINPAIVPQQADVPFTVTCQ